MVSQRVSQDPKKVRIKQANHCSHATACRGIFLPKEVDSRNVPRSLLVAPASQSAIVRKSRSGGSQTKQLLGQSNSSLTQSTTPSRALSPAHISDLPETQVASTAPTPNSYEEVSGMPSKGNGCIFKTRTKAGKVIWKVEVTIGYAPDGRRIRTRRTAHSLSAARELHRKLVSELHTGELRTQSTETLSEYSLWWLRTVKIMSVRPSTLSDYEDRLRRNVFPHFGQRRLHEITSRDVQNWLHILQKKGASTATINGARQVVGAVFKHAVRAGLVPKNPIELTERAKRQWGEKTAVKQPWSLAEAQQVLAATYGTKFDLFARLGVLMGARRGEILALRWEDIDLNHGFISIAGSLREQRVIKSDGTATTSLVVGDTKTFSSRRKVALTAEILASLQRHRDVVAAMKIEAGQSWKTLNGYLLTQLEV